MKNYVESPIDVKDSQTFITKGRKYETSEGKSELSFIITDDRGTELYCLYNRCSHIDGLNWIKTKL